MNTSKISTAEAFGLILSIFVSHTLVSLPENLIDLTQSSTIINILFLSFLVVLLLLGLIKLFKAFPGNDILDIAEFLGGEIFKKIIGLIFIFYFIFSCSILLRNFCECIKVVYFPMTSITFLILSFIIAVVLISKFKLKTSAKINLLILPFTFFSVLFIFFANLNHFSLQNIYPILGKGFFNTFIIGLNNLCAFGGISLIYFLPPHLKEPEKFKKIILSSIFTAIVYLLLCISIILFMFVFLLQVDEIMPLYSAARYIEFGSFFQRLESIFLLIWIIQIACYLSISTIISSLIFQKIANLEDRKPIVIPFVILILGIALLSPNYSVSKFLEQNIYSYLVICIVFILSISILTLGYLKKKKSRRLNNENLT